MYSGMAMYNIENIEAVTVCKLAELFFSGVNIQINGAGYYKMLKGGDHSGDHEIIETTLTDLKEKIKNKEVSAFRVYSEQMEQQPWYASFGYMTKEFGGFNYIDIQYPYMSDDSEVISNFLKVLSEKITFSYGIKYHADKVTKALYYATGDNMVNVYQYENASLFKRDCPGRFRGEERYRKTMLRMVYPLNIINDYHLDIMVKNIELKSWILSRENNGKLVQLSDGLWLWTVRENELDAVNKYLGESGMLICWKAPVVKKLLKKLP